MGMRIGLLLSLTEWPKTDDLTKKSHFVVGVYSIKLKGIKSDIKKDLMENLSMIIKGTYTSEFSNLRY